MSQLFPQICEIESEFARWNCSILTIEECTRSEIESCSHVTRRENIFLIFLFFFFSFSFLFFFFLSFSRSRLIDAMLFTKSKLIRYIYIECLIAKLLGLKSGSSSKQIEISLSTDTMNKFNGELLNFSLASLDRESARKWKVNDVYLYSRQPVHAYTRIFLLQSCKSFLNS